MRTINQALVAAVLLDVKSMSRIKIADTLGFSPQNLDEITKYMEKVGYIVRKPAPPKQPIIFSLTPKGYEALMTIKEKFDKFLFEETAVPTP